MHRTIVCKFGGSSLADGTCFRRVRDIILGDERRACVVVSAPGRRRAGDSKVTDLLLAWEERSRQGQPAEAVEAEIFGRFRSLARDLGSRLDLKAEFRQIRDNLPMGSAFAASRGEYLCGKLMAEYLGCRFLDAAEVIRFRADGSLDREETRCLLRKALEVSGRTVLPGFYGADPEGRVRTFSRGGSDITGALAAQAREAHIYENWSDVPGFLSADPALVPNPARVPCLSYRQLALLAGAGASVLHPESVYPAAEMNIPIHLRYSFAPGDPGTEVRGDASAQVPCMAARGALAALTLKEPSEDRAKDLVDMLGQKQIDFMELRGADGFKTLLLPENALERLAFREESPEIRCKRGIILAAVAGIRRHPALESFRLAAQLSGANLLRLEMNPVEDCHSLLLEGPSAGAFIRHLHHVLYTL